MSGILSIGQAGMSAAWQRLDGAAARIARVPSAASTPGEGADTLAADLVGQRRAAIEFQASVQVVKTGDQVMGSLLDLFA